MFKNYSLLRIFQIIETKKLSLKGKSLEFGASENYKKNFSHFLKSKNKFDYSNIDNNNNNNIIIPMDLRKKLKFKSNIYSNILIYNVLEHVDDHSTTIDEIKRILNKGGNLFGSKNSGFNRIEIKCLGYGPFVACFSIIQSYTKYLPLLNHIILLTCCLLDFILQLFVKTKLNEIYPIGIFFTAKK